MGTSGIILLKAFAGRDDAGSKALCTALLGLIDNVLLVQDFKDHQLYHPRINAAADYSFSKLPRAEQQAFKALHDHYFYEQAMARLPALTAPSACRRSQPPAPAAWSCTF